MDKVSFEKFLDASWWALREHLLSAYPGETSQIDYAASIEALQAKLQKLSSGPGQLSEVAMVASDLQGATVGKLPSILCKEDAVSAASSMSMVSSVRFQEEKEEHQVPVLPEFPDLLQKEELDDDDAPDGINHGDSSKFMVSELSDLSEAERRSIKHRLRIRLGHVTANKLVSGRSLHDAMCALGLTRYEEDEMNDFLNHLATFLDLHFEAPEDRSELTWSGASLAWLTRFQEDVRDLQPVWEWPSRTDSSHSLHSLHRDISKTSFADKSAKPLLTYNVAPCQAVMEIFLAHEGNIHKKIFGPKLFKMFKAMREVLMAGDTNRLVAELTFVRINDLAAPPEPIHFLMYLEPIIALIIIGNGIMIGFQTDPQYANWDSWVYFEHAFAGALLLEILLRFAVLGCREFWCGAESIWNFFDLFLCFVAYLDLILQAAATHPPESTGANLLRFFRLIRLARIVRVFRLKVMKDLRLMLRGLVAGCWTLALAFLLLFAVLYVMAGFATITIGGSPRIHELGLYPFFNNIPASMFTAFRCSTGDCTAEDGSSIAALLSREFGVGFILPYVASFLFVVMGIFNVILAVYVDITMKAAKENDAVTAEQYARESIRVARATRELLKKFAAGYHTFHVEEHHDHIHSHLQIKEAAELFTDDEIHENIEISKELFLLVVQDRGAQKLMDELDLPVNRAQLFDVIDADGSGSLHIQELVQGLLKIRGEVNKGDAIASLLAARAAQQKIEELRLEWSQQFEVFRQHFSKQMESHENFFLSSNSVYGKLLHRTSFDHRSSQPDPAHRPPPLEQLKVPQKPICVELVIDEPPAPE